MIDRALQAAIIRGATSSVSLRAPAPLVIGRTADAPLDAMITGEHLGDVSLARFALSDAQVAERWERLVAS